jgi:hypothetical protein
MMKILHSIILGIQSNIIQNREGEKVDILLITIDFIVTLVEYLNKNHIVRIKNK